MKERTKKIWLAAIVLALLIAVFAGVWFAARPRATQGAKTITVEVVHADGSEKSFTYNTDAEYLADVLQAEGLVEGEMGSFGLYITKVDGESAAEGAYWAVYQGGEYATVGVSELPVNDGDAFSLVYEVWEG